jgi:Meiotically up-regulated gene 113
MTSRELILLEIRKIASRDGQAPGMLAFQKQTGIRKSEWHGVYWRAWGEVLLEAGFEPNKFQEKLSSDEVLKKFLEAIRHFGRIPAEVDLRMYAKSHSDFVSHSTFNNHFGSKAGLIEALREFVERTPGNDDVLALLPEQRSEPTRAQTRADGSVYLLKSGAHYKIGRSDEIEKRVKQITVALPESVVLIHAIQTDDPPGIEAYWHRRFAEKRANGEWFKLSVDDIRAFKRRKFQ